MRQLALRLNQVKEERQKQKSYARTYTWSANLLTFGQYVIGGVLASSFVQQSLTPNIIGFFGLLVLFSSLVKQHYHPDVRARVALQKAAQLQALASNTEDQIATIEASNKNDDAEAVLALVAKVSAVLNEIDSEIIDISDKGKTILKTPARKRL